MSGFSFRQKAAAWQQTFQHRQSAGLLQRILAWLVLGLVLMVGTAILLFMVLLSWLVIPVLIYRYRKGMKAAWQAQKNAAANPQQSHHVIEGEVLDKKED
ncbi:hypothetical protein QE250_12615 [Chromatiaceae bacterium AAb-1]|nr:hypothetical protein [Chromatiaceae bacterium AAb-1]